MANEKIGEAYGFFDCNAPKEEIQAELPIIRKIVNSPSQLEISLVRGMDNIMGDKRLTALAQEAEQKGRNYMLQATYNGTHKDAADEVASILNQAYQSHLYRAKEKFNGAIAYEEKGKYKYVSRD